MPKSELMTKILTDYMVSHPAADQAVLAHFCDYAGTWLAGRGIIGLGLAASGLSLRTTTGDEIALYTADSPVAADSTGQAVNISGNNGGVNAGRGFADSMPSFGITGG